MIANTTWTSVTPSMIDPELPDVLRVPRYDALVDEVGIQGGEQQRHDRLHELEPQHREEQLAVGQEILAEQLQHQHVRAASVGVRMPSRITDAISFGDLGSPTVSAGWLQAMVSAAQDVGGFHRLHAQPVSIGFEHRRHRAEERRPVLVLVALDAGQVGASERGEDAPQRRDATLDDVDGSLTSRFQRERRVDGAELGFDRGGIERLLDGGFDQRLLVDEDPEDRSFGDAGRLRDLPGGDLGAVGDEQRHGRGEDRGPPLLCRHRRRPGARRPTFLTFGNDGGARWWGGQGGQCT